MGTDTTGTDQEPTSFVDLGREMWSFLTGPQATVEHTSEDMTVEVPRATGASAPRTTTRRVTPGTTTVHVDVEDPVALFAALPARLERALLDAAGELLGPAPVVEVTARGQPLALLDPTGSSIVGGLLGGDRRLTATPRGALVVARGQASARGVTTVPAVAVLALLTRRG